MHRRRDGPADRAPFMRAEIIHNDDIAGLQCRHQHRLDIGAEALAVDRPVDDAGRDDTLMSDGRRKVMVRQWPCGPEREPTPPAMGTRHVGLCPRLIDEDETSRIDFKLVPLLPVYQSRRRAMSGRPCSVANTVFEADTLAFEEPPERVA